jgi:hypothetical protein
MNARFRVICVRLAQRFSKHCDMHFQVIILHTPTGLEVAPQKPAGVRAQRRASPVGPDIPGIVFIRRTRRRHARRGVAASMSESKYAPDDLQRLQRLRRAAKATRRILRLLTTTICATQRIGASRSAAAVALEAELEGGPIG